MKKSNMIKIGASLLALCLLFGVYFLLRHINVEEEAEEETVSEEFFSSSSDDIEKISFVLEDGEVTFKKSESEWKNEADENFPVDQEKVQSILDGLESVTSSRSITDVGSLDEYGLEEPAQTIEIEEENSTRTIQLGDYNETADAYYAIIDDSETVYLVEASFETLFEGKLYDFADGESFPVISASDIDKIQVQKDENPYSLIASSDVSSGWIIESGDISEEADSTAVSTTTSSVNSLTYSSFVNYNCENYSEYGLDQPQATIVIDYHQTVEDDDDSEENEESEEQLQVTLKIGSETEDGYYVCEEGSNEVYTMSTGSLDSLLNTSVSDYWNLKVNYYAITDFDSITVNHGGQEDVLSVESTENDEEETEYTYYFNDVNADENDFKNFFNSLVNISAEERLEENYQPSEDPEWTFTFVKDGKQETVAYYTYNENFNVAIKDNGASYLVNKMDVKNLESLLETLKNEE